MGIVPGSTLHQWPFGRRCLEAGFGVAVASRFLGDAPGKGAVPIDRVAGLDFGFGCWGYKVDPVNLDPWALLIPEKLPIAPDP